MTILFILAGLTLLAAAAALTIRAVVLPRLRMLARLEQISGYGVIQSQDEALVGRIGGDPHRIASALGKLVAGDGRIDLGETQRMLKAAGKYQMRAEAVLGYRIAATVTLGALGVTSSDLGSAVGILQAVLFPAFGWFGPFIVLKRLGTFRTEAIDDALPDLVDLLVVTVEAGLSLSASIQMATTRSSGPLGEELRLAMQEQRMGLPVTEALSNMLSRCETASMRSLVQSVTQAETLGVSIGAMLRDLAVEMRKRRRARAEERAQKAPIKMLFPLVFFMFPALFIVILAPAVFQLLEGLANR